MRPRGSEDSTGGCQRLNLDTKLLPIWCSLPKYFLNCCYGHQRAKRSVWPELWVISRSSSSDLAQYLKSPRAFPKLSDGSAYNGCYDSARWDETDKSYTPQCLPLFARNSHKCRVTTYVFRNGNLSMSKLVWDALYPSVWTEQKVDHATELLDRDT